MGRFYPAFGNSNDGIRLRRQCARRRDWIGRDSRSEARRSRDRRASRLGHGSQFVSRLAASRDRRRSGIDDPCEHVICRSSLRNSNGWNRGVLVMPDICIQFDGITWSAGVASCRCHCANNILWITRCSSCAKSHVSKHFVIQCLLSVGGVGFRRRPCRSTPIERGVCNDRLGEPGRFPCRLWRGTVSAGSAVHFCSLPRHRRRHVAESVDGCGSRNSWHLSAWDLGPRRCSCVLGLVSTTYKRAGHHARNQCRGRRGARRGALQSAVDQLD